MNVSSFSSGPSRSSNVESSSRPKTFIIPEKCFEKNMALTWRRGNKFSIYPRSQTVSKTPANITDNKILNIRQEILLFNPILRKLVNESNGTYLSVQKVAEASKSGDNQVEFLKLSRQYRSIVRVCIEGLQEAASKETDGVEKNNLLSFVTIFYSIECIWHLCEILYIDNIPGDVVLPFLLEWVRFHFPCHEQTAAQMLEACERGSEEHPEYWDTVTGMIVQGRVDVARALMKLHSAAESNEFKLVDNSLRSMPVYSVYGGISTGEFTVSWKHWQAECRSKLSSRALASQPQLELIMRLIIGDYSSFESIRDKYASWFDLLGGWLLYTCPWAKRRELRGAAAACAGLRPAPRHPLDAMVRALLEGDLHEVIHEIQQVSDNGWFATHLTDLLYHCGKLTILDKHQTNVTARLRDSLVIEYGCLLLEHGSLWAAGLSYAARGGAEGGRRAALLLERLPPGSDAKAMRIQAEAKKYGMHAVAQSVCVCAGVRALRARRLGAALAWGVRAPAPALCARAAAAALRHYAAAGTLPAADLLLTAGPAMLMADSLVFLGKYCDFHRLYKNREFKKAAKLLVSLITSKIAPDYFWETLLLDTLPLLESDEPVFSAGATLEIMGALELRAGPAGALAGAPAGAQAGALGGAQAGALGGAQAGALGGAQAGALGGAQAGALGGARAALLRLALARNLARTCLADVDDET